MNDLVKRLKGYDYVIVDYATKLELLKLRIRNPLLTFKIFTVEELITKFLGVLVIKVFSPYLKNIII